jgi:hypothetical protein
MKTIKVWVAIRQPAHEAGSVLGVYQIKEHAELRVYHGVHERSSRVVEEHTLVLEGELDE